MVEHVQTKKGPNEIYDQMLEKYRKVRTIVMLQSETNFSEYLKRLADNVDDWTIYISCSNEFTSFLLEEDKNFISEKLGAKLISDGGFQDTYIAVLKRGNAVYEAVSNQRITHNMTLDENTVNLVSSGWLSTPLASIKINGTEYAVNGGGLNFVIYDNETEAVIDSVSFNTFFEGSPVSRNNIKTDSFLRLYETKINDR